METVGKPHVLIIEDDEDISGMLDTILSVSGFLVSVSADGETGLEKARKEESDIVVLDIMMPGKSGIEVMREIRSDPAIKDVPILFLSAVADEATVVQGLKGADDYVLKPFKALELETRIRKILERTGKASEPPGGPRQYDKLAVQIGDDTYFVPFKDIFYFEATGKYCFVYTKNRKFLSGSSIGHLEERMKDDSRFMRIHRSFMVNLEKIHKLTRDDRKHLVVVVNDEKQSELPVSASCAQQVKDRLGA